MPDYVALLRGIAPMYPKMRNAALRPVFEDLGLDDVRTVIASGNVLFSSPERGKAALEARIEAALHDHLGAPCTTIVRSRRQIDALLASGVFDGWPDEPQARCNVTFLKRRPPADLEPPRDIDGAEVIAVRDQAVFSVIDDTRAQTPNLMARIEQTYGKEVSTRTWRTVHRIAAAFAR